MLSRYKEAPRDIAGLRHTTRFLWGMGDSQIHHFNPALTTCASKRMKAAGFRTLHALPHGNAKHFRQSVHCRKSEEFTFATQKKPHGKSPRGFFLLSRCLCAAESPYPLYQKNGITIRQYPIGAGGQANRGRAGFPPFLPPRRVRARPGACAC